MDHFNTKRGKINDAFRASEKQSPVICRVLGSAVCEQSALPSLRHSEDALWLATFPSNCLLAWDLQVSGQSLHRVLQAQRDFETSLILCVRLWQVSGREWAGRGSGCFYGQRNVPEMPEVGS